MSGDLSEKYILAVLTEFLKSKEGALVLNEQTKKHTSALNTENDFLFIDKENKRQMQSVLEKIKNMTFESIKNVIPSFSNSYADMQGLFTTIENDGIHAVISINEDALYRASLSKTEDGQYKTGDGINDIVSLFVHGYKLKSRKPPRGYWFHDGQSIYTRALPQRAPNDFLQVLIKDINQKYNKQGVTATLDQSYL